MRSARELADGIAARLRARGHRALLAGGCVRDLLLGLEPKDYDIATSARPEEVQALFARTVPVGVAFGVVLVLPDGETPFEVATFRRDLGYTDMRRPDAVEFSDEQSDAQRRDFTINGLFLDPGTGEVLDYVGGRSDLARRVLRAIGDPHERIREDRLRMLRAVRFAARLLFAIDPATRAAVAEHASSIVHVSAERIRDEVVKMLVAGDAAVAVELLEVVGLLEVVLPEVSALRRQAPQGDRLPAWEQTLLRLTQLRGASVPVACAALLLDAVAAAPEGDATWAPATVVRELLTRLRFSNEERERTAALVADAGSIDGAPQLSPSALKRLLRRPHFEDHLELHRLVHLATGGGIEDYDYCLAQRALLGASGLNPERLLTGGDLLGLGLLPGPEFARILEEVETAQLDGELASREEALAWVRVRVARG